METVIDGIRIRYQSVGEGEDLLILHGWGCKIEVYQNITDLLKTKYRVHILDLPGFGESDEPKTPFGVSDYARFVSSFIRFLGLKRLHLVGHSHGGRIAIFLASHPDKDFTLQKIVLMDSAGIVPKKTVRQKMRTRVYKMGRWILTKKPVAAMYPESLEALRKKFGSADYNAASPLMRESLVKSVNTDLQEYLPKIQNPTLLLWGAKDTATPLSDGKRMEALLPNGGLAVSETGGHYVFLDDFPFVSRVLSSFFDLEEH